MCVCDAWALSERWCVCVWVHDARWALLGLRSQRKHHCRAAAAAVVVSPDVYSFIFIQSASSFEAYSRRDQPFLFIVIQFHFAREMCARYSGVWVRARVKRLILLRRLSNILPIFLRKFTETWVALSGERARKQIDKDFRLSFLLFCHVRVMQHGLISKWRMKTNGLGLSLSVLVRSNE